MTDIISVLRSIKAAGKLQPYIDYIRFPSYRNLKPNLHINFDFPITALVGQNGTNKSSILRAIYGCPEGYSVGNFWFSTDVDPILDEGRARFIYSYYQPDVKTNVEVVKSRARKVVNGQLNPDYWEPRRPIIRDGMEKMPPYVAGDKGRNASRWHLIKKKVSYMDFRSEISSFDKYFYHGDLKRTLRRHTKQDFIRSKSRLLKKALEQNLNTMPMYRNRAEHVFSNKDLPSIEVEAISLILGREYKNIRVIEHQLFGSRGSTVFLYTSRYSYSEAFAGSGEYAIVMLVSKIFSIPNSSLIILDEPEVSLHPGAQSGLINFLLERVKIQKHQIVLGTHSPFIVDALPPEAIKTLYLNPLSGVVEVTDKTMSDEAFFYLGVPSDKKTIFVEDRLAAEIVNKSLRALGQALHVAFDVKSPPGGATVLLRQYLLSHALSKRVDTLFLLDGDQKPDFDIDYGTDWAKESNESLEVVILAVLGDVNIPVDGGDDGGDQEQLRTGRINVIEYCRDYLGYLPGHTPELFIWENMKYDVTKCQVDFDKIADPKERFRQLCHSQLGLSEYEDVSGEDIFSLQKVCLATVPDASLQGISSIVSKYLESLEN
jgi:predicted ATPase